MTAGELRRAAAYLAANAEGLRDAHTIKHGGVYRWQFGEDLKLEYLELRALAAKLRRLAGSATRRRGRP